MRFRMFVCVSECSFNFTLSFVVDYNHSDVIKALEHRPIVINRVSSKESEQKKTKQTNKWNHILRNICEQ